MREIVLDTETTGLDPLSGDCIVEIGCVELINHIPSGVTWHHYFNPQRSMPERAFAIHGISEEFLSDKPLFSDLSHEFLNFIGDDNLVIHNAPFDVGFLDVELKRSCLEPLKDDRIIDTLPLARRKHPNTPVSLDALCRHYKINHSSRSKHGALLDAKLLAAIYLELIGGPQTIINFTTSVKDAPQHHPTPSFVSLRPIPYTRPLLDWERDAHRSAIHLLGRKALWLQYIED